MSLNVNFFPKRWRTPYHVQIAVAVMYGIKFFTKWKILGAILGSAAISGDGIHNLADAVPTALVAVVYWLSKREDKDSLFGFKQVEAYLLAPMGLLLMLTAFKIGVESSFGLISLNTSGAALIQRIPFYHFQPVRIVENAIWLVAPWLLFYALLSFAFGQLQINIGHETNSEGCKGDGEETKADGLVELAEFASILFVQGLHWRWMEPAIGYVVMFLIGRTGWEIFLPNFRIIRMKSLGMEADERITSALKSVPGLQAILELRHCRVNASSAFCIVRIETTRPVEQHAALRYALWFTLKQVLKTIDEGFEKFDLSIVLKTPVVASERIAFFGRKQEGKWKIVEFRDATHLLICDPRQGDPSQGRLHDYLIPSGKVKRRAVIEMLREKRVVTLRTLATDGIGEIAAATTGELKLGRAYFPDPFLELGMKNPYN